MLVQLFRAIKCFSCRRDEKNSEYEKKCFTYHILCFVQSEEKFIVEKNQRNCAKSILKAYKSLEMFSPVLMAIL